MTVREPGQCRAYIVKALKAMQKNPLYGGQVTAKLESDPDWAEFRDQSHALFLTNAPQGSASTAYLTAGASGASMQHGRFLTSGPANPSPNPGQAAPTPLHPPPTQLGPGGVPTHPPPPLR